MIQITGQYCDGGVEKWTRIQEISTGISADEVYSGKHTTEPEIGLKHKLDSTSTRYSWSELGEHR